MMCIAPHVHCTPSALERQLIVHGAPPASISASELITELAISKRSLTYDRRVRSMLMSAPEVARLVAPAVLGARRRARSTRCVHMPMYTHACVLMRMACALRVRV